MKFELKKELPLIGVVLLPFLYLAYIWGELEEQVPLHWNAQGEIDRYGSKTELIIIPFILPLLVYLIFLVVPIIDPKNNMAKMGRKLNSLKMILTTFMSALAIYIIYSAKSASLSNPNFVFLLIGVLYIVLGNFFKTIRANYFIGIRTPWTLENETVWKKTHELAGKLWFIGGFAVVICSTILESSLNVTVFLVITSIITIIPIVHSYLEFKKEKT